MNSILVYLENPSSVIVNYLKANSSWAKFSDSCWIIKTYKTPGQVRDEIRQSSASTESVIVIDVSSKNWATYAVAKDVTDWLKKEL